MMRYEATAFHDVDFVVIGAGLAGAAAALELASLGRVALIAKAPPAATNSAAAQGGIAAALGPTDDPVLHAADTLAAGVGLCDERAVWELAREAPAAIAWLAALGVPFDHDATGRLALGLEAAHTRPRIVHAAGDATGRAVLDSLWRRLRATPTVEVWIPFHTAAIVLDDHGEASGVCLQPADAVADCAAALDAPPVVLWAHRAVILATGGAGALFARTTNPAGATGDGIALAWRAGAPVRNMEFMQFHPTALVLPDGGTYLVSEAVRGAGAKLVDDAGKPLEIDHPQRDLAPRDVVARAVYQGWQSGRRVLLDARDIHDFATRFPTIWGVCRAHGLNPPTDLLPVAPAAHFLMGGVAADIDGRTAVPRLYAVGETACTGVHGANRLASNSLLECVVTARRAAARAAALSARAWPGRRAVLAAWQRRIIPDTPAVLGQVRHLLWEAAGLMREASRLQAAARQLDEWARAHPASAAVEVARLVVQGALARRESRGAHWRVDVPCVSDALTGMDTELRPGEAVRFVPAGCRPRTGLPAEMWVE